MQYHLHHISFRPFHLHDLEVTNWISTFYGPLAVAKSAFVFSHNSHVKFLD